MACACSTGSSPTISRGEPEPHPPDERAVVKVDFYHLTRSPLDRVLPRIAGKVQADGGRLLIVSADAGQRQRIDRLLWTFAPDSFLPHAQAGEGDAALQVVLIAGTIDAANAARSVAIVDGEWRDGALAFDRAFHFFDDDAIDRARVAWKELAGRDGVERRYWRQGEGGWEQAA